MSPFHTAIERAGGQTALARAIGLSQSMVWQVSAGARPLPPKHAPAVEAATGVPVEELCPDVEWQRDSAGQITGYHVPLRAAG